MAGLLSDDARFFAEEIRGRRFKGRPEIEAYFAATGFEATGYSFTPVDVDYVVVAVSLRRRIDGGGLADSTLALVFRTEDDEIICLDAFQSTSEALASLRS